MLNQLSRLIKIILHSSEIDESLLSDIQEISGKGIKAKVSGIEIILGNDKLLHTENIEHDKCEVEGTVVHLAVNSVYAGYIIISDTLKEDSQKTIQLLKEKNINTVMLTGDNKTAAESFC